MKSVVMIAYFFPPEGNGGVYRSLRFVRHLSKMGWLASVISGAPYRYERYDPELLQLVPSETEVIRVRGRDLWQVLQAKRAERMHKRLAGAPSEAVSQIREAQNAPLRTRVREMVRPVEGWYYRPDMAMPWIRPAVSATLRLCTDKSPNVIWATAGPVSSCIVAQRAAKRAGVPYVLDFRDPWGLDYYYESEVKKPTWVKLANRRTLYRLLKEARAVVFQFRTIAECYWRAYPGALDAERIHIIPNGYEGEMEESSAARGERCTILYAGTLSTYRYDTLLKSLHLLKKTDSSQAKQLRFLFVGEHTEELAREVAELELSDIVETAGPTSNAGIVRLNREANAFLMLGRSPDRRGHELVAGAKLFGYLKGRRPILGVLPQDEARKILEGVGVSTIADAESPSEIVAVLRRLSNAWSQQRMASLLPDRTACKVYSAEEQTASLVRALEGSSATKRFVPGSVAIPPSLRKQVGDQRSVYA